MMQKKKLNNQMWKTNFEPVNKVKLSMSRVPWLNVDRENVG